MLTDRMKIQAITNLVAGQAPQIDCEAFDGRLGVIYRILSETPKNARPGVLDSLCELDPALVTLTGQVLNERPADVELSYDDQEIDSLDGSKMKFEYLWQEWIPRRLMSMIIADPGVGKTLFALDLCRRMLNGLDMPDGVKPNRKRQSILYVDAEDYITGIYRRVKYWQKSEPSLWPHLNAGFYVMRYPENEVLDFGKPAHQDSLVEYVYAVRPDWVIIDSLSSALLNYTFDNDAAPVIVFFHKLMREYDLALTLLHHNNKASRQRQKGDIHNISGAGLFGRRSRTVIDLDYKPEGAEVNKRTDPRRVSCIKANESLPYDLHFKLKKLEPAGVFLDYYQPDPTSLDASQSISVIDKIFQAIEKLGDNADSKNIAAELGYSEAWTRRILKEGVEAGHLAKDGYKKPYRVAD